MIIVARRAPPHPRSPLPLRCRHAAELADNRVLRASLEAFARSGGVVYAECGGLIYLSKSVQPALDEAAIPMGAMRPRPGPPVLPDATQGGPPLGAPTWRSRAQMPDDAVRPCMLSGGRPQSV